ncbi:hypothetical protein [Bergeyella sp. RCAD1439]|uniref:hypothetical protein n=1 Tax=Bergeyella anatis TaxID=3113737 RepID=UPI002E182FB6|nr:hypothetical protein [Bergeyella sp. RCAD1439]
MILIISRDGDTTTDLVIDWLLEYNLPFLRVNDDFYYNICMDFQDFSASTIYDIKISDISVIWFRKNTFLLNKSDQENIIKQLDKSIITFSNNEIVEFRKYFFWKLSEIKSIKWLTNPNKITENKLIQMDVARSVGLRVPKTFVITRKKDLLNFTSNSVGIVKPIVNCIHPVIDGKGVIMKTCIVDRKTEDTPITFPISLVQNLIEKLFEIRVFYIDNEFFATKVVEEENNEIDHRVNIAMNKTRFENYLLPNDIKNKLRALFETFDLNCSSVDLLVDKNGDYYFLEINPTGQFTYHSIFNNTYLEKKIATTLKKFYYEN